MRVYSIFKSIDGEVNNWNQGCISTFIRLAGCNLRCKYCDTKYALDENSGKETYVHNVIKKVKELGGDKITITGGEPLLQKDFYDLTKELYYNGYKVSVETNGSQALKGYGNISWVVDYKLNSSGMTKHMIDEAFIDLTKLDYVKFVISDKEDYNQAKEVMQDLRAKGCHGNFCFSPMIGKNNENNGREIISWLMQDNINDVILNVQLHKFLGLKEDF